MPCYHPLTGYRALRVNPTGKRSIVFNPKEGFIDQPVQLPCGQCIGCKLERSRQWAIRCVHESKLYENNCFITLTYNNEHLPNDKSLHVEHYQKFMKRLRKHFAQKIRYFHCGEYGEKFARPHYHACLFNIDFKDKTLWKTTPSGSKLYVSQTLEKLWPFGYSSIGNVTFESAAYVARYITKKITGKDAENHYNSVNYETGEITERRPEYTTQSQGIGRGFYEKFKSDIYPDDFVLMNGKKVKPPKYYNLRYEIEYPEDYAKLKYKRKTAAMECTDNSPDRRITKEVIQNERHNLLKRNYENDL